MAQGCQKLVPGAEDPVSVIESDAPCLGQHQLAARPVEQGVTQAVFKLLDLDGEGGLRQVQPLGGAAKVPFERYGAEIAQVVIVQAHEYSI